MFIDGTTLEIALGKMYGTAGHLLKIWFALKHMGLSADSHAVEVDTSNSTPSLKRLFSCGAPDGRFYIPFAHTPRYLTMKHDASRSIIQTTIQRWASSGSVVTCDPTEFLEIAGNDGTKLQVRPGRRYPFGLGNGESGFALEDGARVSIPITAFAVWYGRQTAIPENADAKNFLIDEMLRELRISPAEKAVVFVDDIFAIGTQVTPLTDDQIFSVCKPYIDGAHEPRAEVYHETFSNYERRVMT